ncbi:MAG: hypothetical protein WD226_02780 [Planctomycetota bacterium]
MKETPTPDDALVVLQLYDLRREAVMRDSRRTMLDWKPAGYDDLVAITRFEHPDNAAFRQVSSYFEMAFGMAHHGAVHAELLAESTGEGLLMFAKIYPHLERFREQFSPTAFQHAEWIATNTEFGRQRFALFRERLER